VRDYDRADDVVQETCLKALTGSVKPRRDLAACLGGVVRNVAYKLHRGEGRRGKRERAAARPEALPSTSDMVARLEEQRRVLACVHALEEPYRSAILLRYFESRSPKEIAHRLDLSVHTVKTRLKRALHQLRIAMDARHGGSRRAWLGTLLPVAGFRAWPTASATTTGRTVVSQATGMKVVLGLVVLLVVGGGLLLASGVLAPDDEQTTTQPEQLTAKREDPRLAGRGKKLEDAAPDDVAELPVAPPFDEKGAATATTSAETTDPVATEAGDKAGGKVDFSTVKPAVHRSPFGLPKRRGTRFGGGFGGPTGHWTKYQLPKRQGTARLEVTVIDAEGEPIAGADVWLGPPDLAGEKAISFGDLRKIGRTDGQGILRADRLPDGGASVFGNYNNRLNGRRGLDGTHGAQTLLEPGKTSILTLEMPFALGAFGVVKGRVLGPDGLPVRSADVWIGMQRMWTKGDGAFAMQGIAEGEATITVRKTGMASTPTVVEVKAGLTTSQDIRLKYAEEGTVRLEGLVVGPEDEPVPGANIYLMMVADRGTLRNARTDEAGRFVMAGLPERVRTESLKVQGGKIPFYTSHQVKFPEGLEDERITIQLPVRYTQFELRVLDKDTDDPILEVNCHAERPESKRPKSVLSRDYKTNYRRGMVEAGMHKVIVQALDHKDTTFDIDVQPGPDGVFSHTIKLARTNEKTEQIALEVTVTAMDGSPIEKVRIEVQERGTNEPLSSFQGRREGGVFRLAAYSGERRLVVSADGYEVHAQDVIFPVDPGEVQMAVQLRPK